MVSTPAAIPVTIPEVLTVASVVLLLVQVPPAVVSASVMVLPAQTDEGPVIAPVTGKLYRLSLMPAV
jgi:hypothetical protein